MRLPMRNRSGGKFLIRSRDSLTHTHERIVVPQPTGSFEVTSNSEIRAGILRQRVWPIVSGARIGNLTSIYMGVNSHFHTTQMCFCRVNVYSSRGICNEGRSGCSLDRFMNEIRHL